MLNYIVDIQIYRIHEDVKHNLLKSLLYNGKIYFCKNEIQNFELGHTGLRMKIKGRKVETNQQTNDDLQ